MTATASGKNFSKDPTISRNVQLPISNAIKTLQWEAAKQLTMHKKETVRLFCMKMAF